MSGSSIRRTPHESDSYPRDLYVRNGAFLSDADAELYFASHFHLALLCRVWRRDRQPHSGNRGRQLWGLYCAGSDHAFDYHAKHIQRVFRDLFPKVYRHDLRTLVGTCELSRDRRRLCRGRRDKGAVYWCCHLGDSRALCGSTDPASTSNARLYGSDLRELFALWVHHWHLGQ